MSEDELTGEQRGHLAVARSVMGRYLERSGRDPSRAAIFQTPSDVDIDEGLELSSFTYLRLLTSGIRNDVVYGLAWRTGRVLEQVQFFHGRDAMRLIDPDGSVVAEWTRTAARAA